MLYAQVGQHHLARATETSLEPRRGTLSCLRARPPDLATVTAAQPEVACVRPSIVPFVYSKRAAAARSLVSRDRRSNVLCGFRAHQSWNYPVAVVTVKRGGGGDATHYALSRCARINGTACCLQQCCRVHWAPVYGMLHVAPVCGLLDVVRMSFGRVGVAKFA